MKKTVFFDLNNVFNSKELKKLIKFISYHIRDMKCIEND